MKKIKITKKEAKKFWDIMQTHKYALTLFPNFNKYWKDCEVINTISDDVWKKTMTKNQKRIVKIINTMKNMKI